MTDGDSRVQLIAWSCCRSASWREKCDSYSCCQWRRHVCGECRIPVCGSHHLVLVVAGDLYAFLAVDLHLQEVGP